jgi:nucleotide-binding universal stress UspA family protein
MKILLTVDGSRFGWKAIDYFVQHRRAWDPKAAVTLLHVDEGHAESVMKAARRRLLTYKGGYKEAVTKGAAGPAIAAYARRGKFDIIIMGSHGYGAIRQLLIGSVATKVLALCKTPVLLVR